MTTRDRIDTDQLNARVDLRTLAAGYTTLHRESATELSGPCPKCGGENRFHAKADMFFCRTCHPLGNGQSHDAIGFLRWIHEIPFLEAVAMLDSTALPAPRTAPPRAPEAYQERPTPDKLAQMRRLMDAYRADMLRDNCAGREYAYRRGFTDSTLDRFEIGYCADTKVEYMADGGAALAIPWYRGRELFSIHYRYLQPEGKNKLKFCAGGKNRGLLWGRHAMREGGRVLMLIEGELNAMSVDQVAGDAGVDVLSLGGESATLTPAAIAFAQTYPVRIVWMDKPELAKKQAQIVNGGAFWSIDAEYRGETVKCDANELLQRMALRETLAMLLQRAGADARTLSMLGA
jgi:hypothetical protein